MRLLSAGLILLILENGKAVKINVIPVKPIGPTHADNNAIGVSVHIYPINPQGNPEKQ
jgi:hypothetical protein